VITILYTGTESAFPTIVPAHAARRYDQPERLALEEAKP
jgi:hypothetical protein